MTRIADADFRVLEEFLAAYRIPAGLGAQARHGLMKRAHRHVLSALQVWQKLDAGVRGGTIRLGGHLVPNDDDVLCLFSEHFSDLVGSLACAIHGNYKSANFLLRSSVENIVRGMAGVTSQMAVQTTSVYKLFEIASTEPLFLGKAESHFKAMHQIYGELCLFVHSGSALHRDAAHELAQHLKQDTARLREFVIFLERINRASLSALVVGNPLLYTSLHHRARDLVDDVLPSDVRLAALGA